MEGQIDKQTDKHIKEICLSWYTINYYWYTVSKMPLIRLCITIKVRVQFEEAEYLTVLQSSKTVTAWAEAFLKVSWSKQLSAVSVWWGLWPPRHDRPRWPCLLNLWRCWAAKGNDEIQHLILLQTYNILFCSRQTFYLLLKDFSFDSQSVMVLLVWGVNRVMRAGLHFAMILVVLQVFFRIRKVPATVLLIADPAQRVPSLVALLRALKMDMKVVLDCFSSLFMVVRVRLALWDCVSAMETFLENLQNEQVKFWAICQPLSFIFFTVFSFLFLV